MNVLSKLPVAATLILALVAPVAAVARPARCDIALGPDAYRGPCDVDGSGGGSFELTVKGRDEIVPGLYDVGLEVVAPGVGVVSGHNASGHGRSFYDGAFVRSKTRPWCWEQKGAEVDDGRVCVR